jgi:hypothetical protein
MGGAEKVTADALVMSDPAGDSFTAKFDGKEYAFKGDPGITSVSLKKIDENTIQETDIRNGKVITVSRMTVDREGKTMKVTVEDDCAKRPSAGLQTNCRAVADQRGRAVEGGRRHRKFECGLKKTNT